MEIFFQKQNLQLVKRLGQTHRKLQQHEAQEHRDEADRGQRGQRIRGLEKTLWRGKGSVQASRVQNRRLGQDPQVQEHLRQGLRTKLHKRSFQNYWCPQG